MNYLRFKNNNIPFIARIVEKGENYGRNFALTHKNDEPLIEFYDARHRMPDFQIDGLFLGQFVSRYNESTIKDLKTGIFLDSGSTDWSINAENISVVQEWMKEVAALPKENRHEIKPKMF